MTAISSEILTQIEQSTCFAILIHQQPDGDTTGAGFALYHALKKIGKRVTILCSDEFPQKFSYLYDNLELDIFHPEYIISVDVADIRLLGEKLSGYASAIDLCIDHHVSNKGFGKQNLLDACASSTCEIVFDLIQALNIKLDLLISNCLYTGISTDTGCFKYANTTPRTHQIAAYLMHAGCSYVAINQAMFDTKSKKRLLLEQYVMDHIKFYFDDAVALVLIPQEVLQQTKIDSSDFDGLSSLPRQIEGVEVGITIRERKNGSYKISMRSNQHIDVAAICAVFGGGGHHRAAGCTLESPTQETIEQLLEVIGQALRRSATTDSVESRLTSDSFASKQNKTADPFHDSSVV